jgi:hypothetical protein
MVLPHAHSFPSFFSMGAAVSSTGSSVSAGFALVLLFEGVDLALVIFKPPRVFLQEDQLLARSVQEQALALLVLLGLDFLRSLFCSSYRVSC